VFAFGLVSELLSTLPSETFLKPEAFSREIGEWQKSVTDILNEGFLFLMAELQRNFNGV
jgi:hypothetical protein